jgi:hypothetical protein
LKLEFKKQQAKEVSKKHLFVLQDLNQHFQLENKISAAWKPILKKLRRNRNGDARFFDDKDSANERNYKISVALEKLKSQEVLTALAELKAVNCQEFLTEVENCIGDPLPHNLDADEKSEIDEWFD